MPAAWSVQTRQTLHGHQHGELLITPCILIQRCWEVFRFDFHPEFSYFMIWSDTLKFQDRVKCLLQGLCWYFGQKSTDCGATAAPVLHELSGSFSLSGNCCPPAHCVPLPVTKRSVQAVPQLSVLTTGLGSVLHRHKLG